jgi:predicted nucleic acid-binding protein
VGVILDSSIVIDTERRGDTVGQLLREVAFVIGDQKAALSSIGLTELVHGVYRSKTPSMRIRHEMFLQDLLADLEVVPYTKNTAMLAGRLDGEQRSKGIVIPTTDLLIGATALEIGYAVVTSNIRHFQLIPGLEVITL